MQITASDAVYHTNPSHRYEHRPMTFQADQTQSMALHATALVKPSSHAISSIYLPFSVTPIFTADNGTGMWWVLIG
jgi:hypothetical protein